MNQSITANRDSISDVMSIAASTTPTRSRLQHHFATFEQQLDAGKIGMWLFLATEILLFGGLFVGFALQQSRTRRLSSRRIIIWIKRSAR